MVAQVASLYRGAFSGLSRNNWLLGIVMFINRCGTMVQPFMALYLTKVLHYEVTYAGYAMMCYGVGAVTGGYLGGKLSDKIGFFYVMFGSLFCGGLLFIALSFVKIFLAFCAVTFVLGMVGESFRPANSSAIAYYSSPENRTRSYTVHRLAINLGWGTGLALGGWVAGISYTLIFWVDGLTSIAAGIFLFFFLPKPSKNREQKHEHDNAQKNSTSAYRDGVYLFFILLVILFSICFFQLSATMPLYYKDVVKLNERGFGFILSINGILIALVEMALIYYLEGKRSGLTYISWGIGLLAFSFLMLNIFPPLAWVAVASMIILTFGEMLTMPFMNTFWISRSQNHNRGEYAGLYTMAWSVAQIFSPVIGTQIIDHFGYSVLWYFVTALGLFVLFGFSLLKRKADFK
jgi:predicted MFS family arabinose efflux permease